MCISNNRRNKMYIKITSLQNNNLYSGTVFEFHIAAKLRKEYNINSELFSITGNVVFANLQEVRKFVAKINRQKTDNEKLLVSEVSAAGLMDEIFHFVLRRYEEEINPKAFSRALEYLDKTIGEERLRKLFFEFVEVFPPADVYTGKYSVYDYLRSYTGNKSNKEILLEEMLLLYLANQNPANTKLKEFFDDNYLVNKKIYENVMTELNAFFKKEEAIGTVKSDLFEYLMTPIKNNPENLTAQLDYILSNWGIYLKDNFTKKILLTKDLIKEEIIPDGVGGGEIPTIVPRYKSEHENTDGLTLGKSSYDYAKDINMEYEEPEQFTADTDWMPNVILMAKNVYVWLNQLSKKYNREIKHLNHIPDEELDELARRNINGLWLIGLWERSSASKKIKHIMGNIDAVASAYSLYDYIIAADLGGEEAYADLNKRAWERGIRLASDMVPNHTGIYSDWIINHPDYFVQVQELPFPYTFNGADLSDDPNIEIKIEDGYWEKRDAAVVFRRIDKRYNDVRYIYHGNDGTNMPWNDTAQLDMLKAEVREAVIQKIFDVARKFSIIRFDAAMTLAKKHFQRLWYPQPGTGGDIPSRTDFSMTRAEFDAFFPMEFWREVVDRINKEMPQTLLLAEAFWLMEGYFVRTLGMHRVYNSAFMHMMMKEENEKYRELIFNTLEFEPEILKRYVNFMSNPDEETAIHQFGSDDKYFGVLTLMITLPGLPMFAHGQIEGFTEKYGMEYKRAYYNEYPNDRLVERHEREIFPITRKRYLFSEVENFWFYDFYDMSGNLNDNVFVFTNSIGAEKTLVLYNNKYDRAFGNFKKSTPKLVKIDEENKTIKEMYVTDALNIKGEIGYFYIVKDMVTNLEYIFNGMELCRNGFYFELNGFEHRVYTNFREVKDVDGDYYEIYKKLNGFGVPSVKEAIEDNKLTPAYNLFSKIFDETELERIIKETVIDPQRDKKIIQKLSVKVNSFFEEIGSMFEIAPIAFTGQETPDKFLNVIRNINLFIKTENVSKKKEYNGFDIFYIFSDRADYKENLKIFLAWVVFYNLQKAFAVNTDVKKLIDRILHKSFAEVIYRTGKGEKEVTKIIALLELLLEDYNELMNNQKGIVASDKKEILESFLKRKEKFVIKIFEDNYVHNFLGVNIYKDVRYFNKERFEEFIKWLLNIFMFTELISVNHIADILQLYGKLYNHLIEAAEESGFRLDELEEILIHRDIK